MSFQNTSQGSSWVYPYSNTSCSCGGNGSAASPCYASCINSSIIGQYAIIQANFTTGGSFATINCPPGLYVSSCGYTTIVNLGPEYFAAAYPFEDSTVSPALNGCAFTSTKTYNATTGFTNNTISGYAICLNFK